MTIDAIVSFVVLLGIILWQSHCLKANSRSYFEDRDRTTDRHIRDLLSLSQEYSRVLKKSRAWKKAAKRYYNLYKEKANV